MRLTLIILMAIAMTGCSSATLRNAIVAADESSKQWQATHPDKDEPSYAHKQVECTPTYEMNGNQRVYSCQ